MNNSFILEMGQRLGWTLVHSVWQFALIALLLAIGLRLLRGCSSQLRYGFMLTALCAMTVVSSLTYCGIVSVVGTADSAQHVGESLRDSQSVGQTSNNRLREPPQSTTADHTSHQRTDEALKVGRSDGSRRSATSAANAQTIENILIAITTTTQNLVARWMNAILAAWFFGMLVLSIRPLVSWRATRILRSQGRSLVPAQIAGATKRVAKRLRIRQVIEVTQSTLVDVPTVIGWLKPLVLLPASAISGLTNEQLEAVIAHELAHVRRHDYLINLFQLLMETIFFYHPAVWWVSYVMRVEREACCDDIAVHMTGDRVGYAKLLLWLEEARNPSSQISLGMSSRGGSLLDRIRRIVTASPQATGVGPLAISAAVLLIVSIGSLLALSVGATSAQENTKSAAALRDIAGIRSWLKRSVEFKDWSRLTQLAKVLADEGEPEEAMEWLNKIPLGKYKDGNYPPDLYYKDITEICQNALKHDRLDFVENTLEDLFNPDKQSLTSKQFPPRVFGVDIALLEFHISKGDIDKAVAYLNSRPVGSRAQMVVKAIPRASHNGHTENVVEFCRRVIDRDLRFRCQQALAYRHYRQNAPDSVWQLADQMAIDYPDDLIGEVIIRDMAMHCYAKLVPDRFVELVPFCRELIAKLPNTKPSSPVDSSQQALSREQIKQLADTDRVRYMGNLALYAAYAKQYELAVRLSANVPMLTTSSSMLMNLSDRDRHPVLYAVTELQKQHEFEKALSMIALVENEAVALASLARLANNTGFQSGRAKQPQSYQRMVERLTQAYVAFTQKYDEATTLDVYESLPESLHIHLQRISDPKLQATDVPYFKRERLLMRREHFDFLIEQGRVDELVQHVEGVLKDGNVNGASWIVRLLASSDHKAEYQRLSERIRQAAQTPKEQTTSIDYRSFLEVTAVTAYNTGNSDLCYDTLMKLDRNTIIPSRISEIAYKARESGDLQFLRRMESSPSRLMREAALEALAVHHVLNGDIEAAKTMAETFDREFGKNRQSWSIYRTITDERVVKDPAQLLAVTQLALQQVSFESKDYSKIAVQRAKLLGRLHPDRPLPSEWLTKLEQNPKLKYEVELAHSFGSWEKAESTSAIQQSAKPVAAKTTNEMTDSEKGVADEGESRNQTASSFGSPLRAKIQERHRSDGLRHRQRYVALRAI